MGTRFQRLREAGLAREERLRRRLDELEAQRLERKPSKDVLRTRHKAQTAWERGAPVFVWTGGPNTTDEPITEQEIKEVSAIGWKLQSVNGRIFTATYTFVRKE
jgi:hypothetical protein